MRPPMTSRLQTVCAILIFLAAMPAVWVGLDAYEERQKIMSLKPSELPGAVLYFTSPG